MKVQELFAIILKVFGIYLIKDVFFSILPVFGNAIELGRESFELGIFSLILSLLTFGLQLAIVYLLLYKTNVIIDRLKLTSGFSEEALSLNLHRSSIYSIAIIVSGIIILVFAIPNLLKQIYSWLEYIEAKNEFYGGPPFQYGNLFATIAEVVIGSLFLTKKQTIANFIELNRREKIES
jgi:hypothetical protein